MAHDLHEISFQLGAIKGTLEAIEKNTSEMKMEFKGIFDRVTIIENDKQFSNGVHSQNKKIAGIIGAFFGSIFGMVGAVMTAWVSKVIP